MKTCTCLKCDGKNNLHRAEKQTLLSQFKADQKVFDKAFRQEKRKFENNSFKSLADLAEKASNDPAEMWKRLKALSDRKPASVLLEIRMVQSALIKRKFLKSGVLISLNVLKVLKMIQISFTMTISLSLL